MKKILVYVFALSLISTNVFALETVFDSQDRAIEVKYATSTPPTPKTTTPQLKMQNTTSTTPNAKATTQTTPVNNYQSIKQEKFNSALVNLDDAQVELRQELAVLTAKYNTATAEKEKAIQHCKNLKNEINELNKKMKNVEKSKKMINKNLETT